MTETDDVRAWGLSGSPIDWAFLGWQPLVAALRSANRGEMPRAALQPLLDATFPDADYDVDQIALAHPPVGTFTVSADGLAVTYSLDGDSDLSLSADHVEWEFGDGTAVVRSGLPVEHRYAVPGTYTAQVSVVVAGSVTATLQAVVVGEVVTPPPDPEEPPPDPEEPPPEEEVDGYSPADHTVDEVLAYAVDNPDEVDAIVAAEETGKNRVTLLEALAKL